MRKILITIEKRVNKKTGFIAKGREFVFNGIDADPIYAFSSMVLNYSITTSNVTSMLYLTIVGGMPESEDIIKSGQYVTVVDNGETVFQGNILTAIYKQFIIPQTGVSILMLTITLIPSIFQFVSAPLFFDNAQATQVGKLLGINIKIALVGKTQTADFQTFISGIIENTDYNQYYNKVIEVTEGDIADTVYTISGTGESIDSVIRQTISYYNAVLYQQEDGTIVIRQLDPELESPFDIDLNNQNLSEVPAQGITPVAPILEWEYTDNACATPSVVAGYNIIPASIAALIDSKKNQNLPSFPLIISYRPNYDYYPNMGDLIKTGWFVGVISNTQINDNVVTDPNVSNVVSRLFTYKEQYLIASDPVGFPTSSTTLVRYKNIITAYQQLMTSKEMATLLARYSSVSAIISLDDPNLEGVSLNKVVGTCLQIGNCDMKSGIIASCSRLYSIGTPYITITVLPLGSITGFWKNSKFNPTFTNG